MKNVILNASFALFVSAAAMSHARAGEKISNPPQITVSYADLDLSREDGARVMLQRLETAARHVCGGWPTVHSIDLWMEFRSCTTKAEKDAVATLGSPMVSALYGAPAERVALRQ